jgi:hypothetical protein
LRIVDVVVRCRLIYDRSVSVIGAREGHGE